MEQAGDIRDNFYPVHSATREDAIDAAYDGPDDYPQHELLKQVSPDADVDTGKLTQYEEACLGESPDPDMPAIQPEEPVYLACGNSYFGDDLGRVLDALYVAEHNRHMEIFGG